MEEYSRISPKKKLSLAGMKCSSPTEPSFLLPTSKAPLRSVAAMLAEIPWISPKKTSSSAGIKRFSPSEALSPPPKSKVSRRPLAAMMATWKRLNAEEEDVPHAPAFVHSHPPIPTTSIDGPKELAGSVEEVEDKRTEDTSSPSPPESPVNFPTEQEIEECVASWEDYLEESNQKWHRDNPYR